MDIFHEAPTNVKVYIISLVVNAKFVDVKVDIVLLVTYFID